MIEKLVAFEERLTRIEAALLVGVVVFMLFLAVYNVFYRNVLIPLQVSVVESATVEVEVPIEPEKDSVGGATEGSEDSPAEDFGGGFGGGFEDGSDEPGDEAGFGGGFGDETADEGRESSNEAAGEDPGFGGGFDEEVDDANTDSGSTGEAGGFGGGFEDDSGDTDGDGFGGGFGGGFDQEGEGDSASRKREQADAPTVRIERRGPEEGSFALFVADAVDAVKLEWIDLVLRQLVLVVGFLGSMLATRRRKHITIDALSKIMPLSVLPWIQVFTNLLSVVICGFLAIAGWDLVQIGLEFPKELTEWAEEWMFQLSFPIGFGMLALHFGVRVAESVVWAATGEPVGTIEIEERPIAASATAGSVEISDATPESGGTRPEDGNKLSMSDGSAGEEPAGEEPAGEEPAGEEPAGEEPAGEEEVDQ